MAYAIICLLISTFSWCFMLIYTTKGSRSYLIPDQFFNPVMDWCSKTPWTRMEDLGATSKTIDYHAEPFYIELKSFLPMEQ